MAAELAGSLAVGGSCPVCGSVEHPSPATASSTVSQGRRGRCARAHESADFERQTVQDLVTTLATRLQSALVRSSGHTVTHWRRAATAATAAASESSAAEREATRLRDELAELESEEKAVATELAATRVSLEERTREQAGAKVRLDRLVAELDHLLSGHPGTTTVAGLVAGHRRARGRARGGPRGADEPRTRRPRAHPGRGWQPMRLRPRPGSARSTEALAARPARQRGRHPRDDSSTHRRAARAGGRGGAGRGVGDRGARPTRLPTWPALTARLAESGRRARRAARGPRAGCPPGATSGGAGRRAHRRRSRPGRRCAGTTR